MDELISLFQSGLPSRESAADILSVNRQTARHGLVFTPRQAASLVAARERALSATGRLELAGGVIKKLILAFCDSPYFDAELAEETLCPLLETFYQLKNETFDAFSDDTLIAVLRELFDGACKGCMDVLQDAAFEQLIRRAHGANDCKEEEEEQYDIRGEGGNA